VPGWKHDLREVRLEDRTLLWVSSTQLKNVRQALLEGVVGLAMVA
jgi:hypothetical protein